MDDIVVMGRTFKEHRKMGWLTTVCYIRSMLPTFTSSKLNHNRYHLVAKNPIHHKKALRKNWKHLCQKLTIPLLKSQKRKIIDIQRMLIRMLYGLPSSIDKPNDDSFIFICEKNGSILWSDEWIEGGRESRAEDGERWRDHPITKEWKIDSIRF